MTLPGNAIQCPEINLTSEQIAVLRGICDRTLRARPELEQWILPLHISNSELLPFLPMRCFREANVSPYPDTQQPGQKPQPQWTEFFSSGSTNVVRARHRMGERGLAAYRKSACEGILGAFERFGIARQVPILSLVPPPILWPDSSLSAMLSFWKEAGLLVSFVDVSENGRALEQAFADLNGNYGAVDEVVIFGTSIHHLHISQWQEACHSGRPFLKAGRVWCFDTGGTKGRTQNTTQSALHKSIEHWFSPDCEINIVSEYGMCELASQAYSAAVPHNSVFQCAEELRVVAISPQLDSILPTHKKGFLGFIDLANVDSWPCIISEDLGSTLSDNQKTFKLEGRAPDASIKGCSLNVRKSYRFDLNPHSSNVVKTAAGNTMPVKRTLFRADSLLQSLDPALWTPSALSDLKNSLNGWAAAAGPSPNNTLELSGQSIAAVTSANIPITWLFPATHAWLLGASSFDVFLPSIRQEDPLSALVRQQIINLAAAFNQAAGADFVTVQSGRILSDNESTLPDRLLVFGTDETIETISGELLRRQSRCKLIPMGHFQNSSEASDFCDAETLGKICSFWFGRGCLTPLEITIPNEWTPAENSKFCENLFHILRAEMTARYQQSNEPDLQAALPYLHQHNLAEARAQTYLFNHACVFHQDSNAGVVVADLTLTQTFGSEKFREKMRGFAGSGWVNIVRRENITPHSVENPTPGLNDNHQGHSWKDWLLKI